MALEKAVGCPGWLDANADADGYYRVLYQGDLLNALLKDDARVLTLPEKVSLIGDIQALTGNGKIQLGKALALAPALAGDSHREVVTKTMDITSGLEDRYLVADDLAPRYHRYLMDVYGGRARSLGWKASADESDDARLLRPRLAEVMANQAEDPEAIAEAKKLALAWLDDHKAVPTDMLDPVLWSAAQHGDRALFDRMLDAARREKDEAVRRIVVGDVGSFGDPEIAKIAMPIVLTGEFDSRESLIILFYTAQSAQTRDVAYQFVKENWDALVAKLPTDTGASLPYVAGGYCDPQHRQDVANFFQGRSTKYTGGPRNLAQVLEGIDLCIAYRAAQAPSVAEFLQQYGSSQ